MTEPIVFFCRREGFESMAKAEEQADIEEAIYSRKDVRDAQKAVQDVSSELPNSRKSRRTISLK